MEDIRLLRAHGLLAKAQAQAKYFDQQYRDELAKEASELSMRYQKLILNDNCTENEAENRLCEEYNKILENLLREYHIRQRKQKREYYDQYEKEYRAKIEELKKIKDQERQKKEEDWHKLRQQEQENSEILEKMDEKISDISDKVSHAIFFENYEELNKMKEPLFNLKQEINQTDDKIKGYLLERIFKIERKINKNIDFLDMKKKLDGKRKSPYEIREQMYEIEKLKREEIVFQKREYYSVIREQLKKQDKERSEYLDKIHQQKYLERQKMEEMKKLHQQRQQQRRVLNEHNNDSDRKSFRHGSNKKDKEIKKLKKLINDINEKHAIELTKKVETIDLLKSTIESQKNEIQRLKKELELAKSKNEEKNDSDININDDDLSDENEDSNDANEDDSKNEEDLNDANEEDSNEEN